jgi:asparagine synthase (glutamine-hydrolysing)
MCGINGIIYFNKVSSDVLNKKISVMQKITDHRGSDQSDISIFDQAALGVNRFNEKSTIQSMDKDREYAVFNGEIVNHQELRKFLKNPPVDKHSDTAIILPLYKQFGKDFIKKLAGMFAIAIYSEDDNSVQLWRDPLGIKPLYYFYSKECVIFSSEIKAIYAVTDEVLELNFAAIDDCLKYRFHPGGETVFPEIKRILPGETVTFNRNGVTKVQYWFLNSNAKSLDKDIDVERFQTLLIDVIKENAQADVKGGFFVSGGLDSSLVTSIALNTPSPYRQPISIKFSPNPVVDEEYGMLLEKFLNTKFEWVEITDEIARETLIDVTAFLDEPLENPIHIGTYLMAKRAKDLGIKSVLTGDGSDEFFLGYQRHVCWFNEQTKNPTEAYPKWLWTMTPEECDELYKPEAKMAIRPMIDVRGNLIEPFLSVEKALLFERLDRLTEYHNMRLDRMTMAHGVEAKVPFLDHRFVELALQVPLTTLFGTSGKGWLQEVARPFIPKEILNRPKIHFPSLPDQWLSGTGADWTKEILLDQYSKISKWINITVLERYIKEHKDGTHKHGRLLWALLTLELWLKNVSCWRK